MYLFTVKYSPTGTSACNIPSVGQGGMGPSREWDPSKFKGTDHDKVTCSHVGTSTGEYYPLFINVCRGYDYLIVGR